LIEELSTVITSVPDVSTEEFGGNSQDQHRLDIDLQDKSTILYSWGGHIRATSAEFTKMTSAITDEVGDITQKRSIC
jgi:hypothetical protein